MAKLSLGHERVIRNICIFWEKNGELKNGIQERGQAFKSGVRFKSGVKSQYLTFNTQKESPHGLSLPILFKISEIVSCRK
jgi:hypothetical protein